MVPSEVQRGELARELATALVAGRHCLLLGRELMGKSPVVRDVAKLIQDEGCASTIVALVDFRHMAGRLWEHLGMLIAETLRCSVPQHPGGGRPFGDWHLVELLASVQEDARAPSQTIVLFDHVDELPSNCLHRFAGECSAVVNMSHSSPELPRVSMLWCGDEDRIVAPISKVESFPRIADTWRIACYGAEDLKRLVGSHASILRIPDVTLLQETLMDLSGGHPSLLRLHGDSYMRRLIDTVPAYLFSSAAAQDIAEKYASKLLARVGQSPSRHLDVSCRLANDVSRRIGYSAELLTLVMCLRLSDDVSVPAGEFPGALREHGDLFVEDSGRIHVRGLILQEFIRRHFTFRRLAQCFFCLDSTRDSWGKAILCCQLAASEGGMAAIDDIPRRDNRELTPPFLEALADRLHAATGPHDLLDGVILTIRHFLGVPRCIFYEVHGSDLSHIRTPANRFVPSFATAEGGTLVTSLAPEQIGEVLRTGRPATDEGTGAVAVPILDGPDVRYVLWAEPSTEGARLPDALRTIVGLAEGPVAAALWKQRQGGLIRRLVTDNPEDRVIVVDRMRRLVLCSKPVLSDIGQTEAVLGRPCSDVFGPGDRRLELCEKVFATTDGQHTYSKWEVQKDGHDTTIHVDVHAWPIVGHHENIELVCQIARDITASVGALEGTVKLLGAKSNEEVHRLLVESAREIGFSRARLYLMEHPERGFAGSVTSHMCSGHDGSFTDRFRAGGFAFDAEGEKYWYDPFRKYGNGVVCVRAELYQVRAPQSEGDLTEIDVPTAFEQVGPLRQSKRCSATTCIEVGDKCFGTFTVDMGEQATRIPRHMCHRLFSLVRMAAQTLAAIEYRARFLPVRGFRHSLAQPVGVYMLMLETAARTTDPERRKRAAELGAVAAADIIALSDRLRALLDEPTRVPLDLKRQDVVPAVKSVVELFSTMALGAGICVHYEGPDSAKATADEVLLRAILRNLVENAVKAIQAHTAAGRRDVTVRVIASPAQELERIEIEDTGMGVPLELLKAIFSGHSLFGGSGTGLQASCRFAEFFGASIRADNRGPEGGAVFTITFEPRESHASETARSGD